MAINCVSVMNSYEYQQLQSYYQLRGSFVMLSCGNRKRNTGCDDPAL